MSSGISFRTLPYPVLAIVNYGKKNKAVLDKSTVWFKYNYPTKYLLLISD
jgi:hypothetical protein